MKIWPANPNQYWRLVTDTVMGGVSRGSIAKETLEGREVIRGPQQSYRQGFVTTPDWQTLQLPFVQFMPHRIDIPLDVRRLRRIGLVAIGREFAADLAVARLAIY